MIIGAGSEGAARTSQRNVLIVPNAQWKELGGEKNSVQRKNKRTHLTPTGLLMEGDYSKPHRRISEIGLLASYLECCGDSLISKTLGHSFPVTNSRFRIGS